MTLKLCISIGDVLFQTSGVHNPKFASRVIRNGGKKLIIKRRELKIIYNTLMTMGKRDSHIKLLEIISLETCERTRAIPANSSEFTIASDSVRIVLSGRDDTLKLLGLLNTEEIFELKRCL